MADKKTTETKDAGFAGSAGKAAEETLGRVQQMFEQLATMEGKAAEQMRQGMDEAVKLAKAQLDYNLKLAAEWRNLMFETSRRAIEMATPSA